MYRKIENSLLTWPCLFPYQSLGKEQPEEAEQLDGLIKERLNHANESSQKRVQRLRRTTLLFALILIITGFMISNFAPAYSNPWFLAYALMALSGASFLLSFLPSDGRRIQTATVWFIMPIYLGLAVGEVFEVADAIRMIRGEDCEISSNAVPCWYIELVGTLEALFAIMYVLLLVWYSLLIKKRESSEKVLKALWRGFAMAEACGTALGIPKVIGAVLMDMHDMAIGFSCLLLVQILVSIFCFQAKLIHSFQCWLMSSSDMFSDARKRGRLRLLCLRGPTLFIGSVLLCSGICFQALLSVLESPVVLGLAHLTAAFGLLTTPLSLLPGDRHCLPVTYGAIGIPALLCNAALKVSETVEWALRLQSTCVYRGVERACWALAVNLAVSVAHVMVALGLAAWMSYSLWQIADAARLLERMWIVITVFSCSLGVFMAVDGLTLLVLSVYDWAGSLFAAAVVWFAVAAISHRHHLIQSIQGWLMSHGEAATAAASVAELIGGHASEHILATARGKFSCVSADKLLFDDMKENIPNPSLGALAEKATLGQVSAFVSHSWHDDPESKWAALQRWRRDYKSQKGEEPTFWIDKYCINQNTIEESLACLPVYLAGCSKLLILCGRDLLQ